MKKNYVLGLIGSVLLSGVSVASAETCFDTAYTIMGVEEKDCSILEKPHVGISEAICQEKPGAPVLKKSRHCIPMNGIQMNYEECAKYPATIQPIEMKALVVPCRRGGKDAAVIASVKSAWEKGVCSMKFMGDCSVGEVTEKGCYYVATKTTTSSYFFDSKCAVPGNSNSCWIKALEKKPYGNLKCIFGTIVHGKSGDDCRSKIVSSNVFSMDDQCLTRNASGGFVGTGLDEKVTNVGNKGEERNDSGTSKPGYRNGGYSPTFEGFSGATGGTGKKVGTDKGEKKKP